MRFLHTADWQIGMKAAHVGPAGEKVREERLAAGSRVVDLANDEDVDFLLVVGDLFEDQAVGRTLVQRTGDVLARFTGPVYILPGNHDPAAPGSVWEHPVWSSHENLHLLNDAVPVTVPGGTLHPCPVREKHSRADPTRKLAVSAEDRGDSVHVGVAHGTVEGVPVTPPDFPIPRNAAARAGLDYLALGHWHSTATYPEADGSLRMAYSGTHEPTRFGERDSGNVLVVSIAERGATPSVTKRPTGGLDWVELDRPLREACDLAAVREEIDAIPDPGTTLVRVKLSGTLPTAAIAGVRRLREVLASRFLYSEVTDEELVPSFDSDDWLEELPAGPVRMAAERLRERNDPVAARALLELYALSRGGPE